MRRSAVLLVTFLSACSRSQPASNKLEGARLRVPASFAHDPAAERLTLASAQAMTPGGEHKVLGWREGTSSVRLTLEYQDVASTGPTPRAAIERLDADFRDTVARGGVRLEPSALQLHERWAELRYVVSSLPAALGKRRIFGRLVAGVTVSGRLVSWTVTCGPTQDDSGCNTIIDSLVLDDARLGSFQALH